MKMHEAAVLVLKDTKNDAVMAGDGTLLHQIAIKAGRMKEGEPYWLVEKRVLDALSHDPGKLLPGKTIEAHGRKVRIFRMPVLGDDFKREVERPIANPSPRFR